MSVTKQLVTDQLAKVIHPKHERDLVSLGMVSNVAVCDEYINIRIDAGVAGGPMVEELRHRVREAVMAVAPEIEQLTIDFVATSGGGEPAAPGAEKKSESPKRVELPQQGQRSREQDPHANVHPGSTTSPLPNVKHIIAVGAGKGGVGKSTVSVNLAIGLSRLGYRVGMLDGDIYGPSAPTLLGLQKLRVTGTQQSMNPFEVHGIKAMTIGKLVDPSKPLIWRGPMAHGAFRQLAMQTAWGELDYLIVDLPPGTGDVPLTLAQMLPLDGAVIVCTPQQVAVDDAVRAVGMFRQLNVRVLGVVENMSYFVGDDGKEYDIFGRGGARRMAEEVNVTLLGTVPIHMELRANCDEGTPVRNFEGNEQLAGELMALAKSVVDEVERGAEPGVAGRPSLSVS